MTKRVACALAETALLLGGPSPAFAQGGGMAGMGGMDMPGQILSSRPWSSLR